MLYRDIFLDIQLRELNAAFYDVCILNIIYEIVAYKLSVNFILQIRLMVVEELKFKPL